MQPDEYEKGYRAWEQGAQREHNPHHAALDLELWAKWDMGWCDARRSYNDYLSGQEE